MKKVLCFAAAAMTLFASCQKTEIVYHNDKPQEIAFVAVNKVPTKAPVPSIKFLEGDNMRVSAYLAKTDDNNAGNIGNYFENILFEKGSTYWAGGQYWPLSFATMNFLAVTEKGGGVQNNKDITYNSTDNTFTVVLDNSDPKAQTDFMYAIGQGSNSGNSSTATAVDMKFSHALAWVNFTFTSNITTTGVIVVESVSLNARYGGTATVTPTNFTSPTTTLSAAVDWTTKSDATSINVTGLNASYETVEMEDVDLANASSLGYGNGLMVVPTTAGDDPYFTITYTIKQSKSDGNTEAKQYTYTHTLTDATWEAGKKYTYNININLQEIEVKPDVEGWDTTDNTINIG